MKVVAITGGIGSGKSVVLDAFKDLGADVYSADAISHSIMLRGGLAYCDVLECFGDEILDDNREIDRKKLGDIVFSDKEKLEKLNEITHSKIYEELIRLAEASKCDIVCLEIPLLFSAKCPIKLDLSIGVVADEEIRLKRVMDRDLCTYEQAKARMKKQLPDSEIISRADCVIYNNGNIDEVRDKAREIYKTLAP